MADIQNRQYIFIGILLLAFSTTVVLSAIPVAVPTISRNLYMNALQTGWLSLAFSLTTSIFILPFGRISDRLGRKRIITTGMIIFIAALLLSAVSTFPLMLIFTQVLLGIGSSMTMCNTIAILSSVYAPGERGRIFGFFSAVVYAGISLGPTIGGLLAHNFGWRSIFVPTAILLVPSLVFISSKMKNEPMESKEDKYDLPGAILYAVMLFSIIYGFSSISTRIGQWIILAGMIALVLFILREAKAKNPILNLGMLVRNRFFSFSNLVHFLAYFVPLTIAFILSLYLQYIKGVNPQITGLILLAQPVIMVIISPFAGRISDKIQPRIIVSCGIFIGLLGILTVAISIANAWLSGIIIGLTLIGFGCAIFQAPNTNAIMGSVDNKYYGVAAGLEATTKNMGISFGQAIITLLLSIYIGTSQIIPQYYPALLQSIKVTLIIFAAVYVCCICVSAARGKLISVADSEARQSLGR